MDKIIERIFLFLFFIVNSNVFFFSLLSGEVVDKRYILFSSDEVSSIEKSFLDDVRDGRLDSFSLIEGYLLLTGVTNEKQFLELRKKYAQKISALLNRVRTSISDRKKADRVCAMMHVSLLRQYELDSIFMDALLIKGVYNCVSSAAVYGDLLDRLNINFQYAFVEKHVYQYVLIGKEKILVETTSPIGFDPSRNNIRTNSQGDAIWLPKKNYTNIHLADKLEFLGMLGMDKRVITRQRGDIDKNLTLVKKSLLLNPAHLGIINNYIVWSSRKGAVLIEANDGLEAKNYLWNTIRVLPENIRHQRLQAFLLSKAFAFDLIAGNYREAQEHFLKMKSFLKPDVYIWLVENSIRLASQTFLQADRFDEIKQLTTWGNKILPDNKKIRKLHLLASKENFKADLNIENFLRSHFSGRSKNDSTIDAFKDEQFKQNFYEIMTYLVDADKIAKIDKAFHLLSTYLNEREQRELPKFAGHIFQALLYKSHENKLYERGLDLYSISLRHTKDKSVEKNYLALLNLYTVHLYETTSRNNLEVVINFLLAEEKKRTAFKDNSYFASRMSYFVVQEVDMGNGIRIVSWLKKIKAKIKADLWVEFMDWILVNGGYKLYQRRDYAEAIFLMDAFEKKNTDDKVKNNYLACLQKLTDGIVLQNDDVSSLGIFKRALRTNPQWRGEISKLMLAHFSSHLIKVYNQGKVDTFKTIFTSLAEQLMPSDYDKLFSIVYVNGSYELIKHKQYRKAVGLAERGLADRHDANLEKNYRFARHKMTADK